ncbi:transcription intermediary factor 1-alpha isoform X2 [Drosophila guanche]|uniref:Blast:E3 ubiquitin-protein ligase TRIM33 n=1 Tax=Drosophila guanche TaxID=7266 RepID=A0A3B0KG02_DROGU|nr:transcription intermediary factor 1-alpha isoform X2 [Drosophila guanche]SPP82568.1 blast:E3 ubiquitin-protein ligase TRIM33 [Drosophila guanche]
MDLDLDHHLKNDFLPLIAGIKQELLDTGPSDGMPQMNMQSAGTASSGAAATTSTSSSSASSVGNPCDSAEKRSESNSSASAKFALFKCVYCAQLLGSNDRPKLLECLHVACSQCVNTKFSELDRSLPPLIHCPVCDTGSQNELIVDNQFLIEQCAAGESGDGSGSDLGQKSAPAIVQCSSCSDGAAATSWCVDCSEYICDSCVQAHQRLKITKDHTIKPKDEANNEQLAGTSGVDKLHMCQLHTQEKLSLFCETCDKLTCRDCQLSDHRDHKYKFAHEIATESRQALSTLVSEINYKRFLLSSATKVIDDRQQLIHDKKKDLIKEITAMAVKITNTVNTRGKQLIMRLNEVCDSKLKVLVEKKETLQLLSDNTDHCIEFMQNALDKGSDFAILSSKKSLVRHLQKLKCQRADIPNPEIPVRIQVQLNQVSDLQKVISQLGIIIVDGKPYPPTASPNGTPQPPPRQPPSPNMAPPLRPGLPPGMSAGLSPNGPPVNFGPQNGPPMYSTAAAQQQFNNLSAMSRSFPGDGPGKVRFAGMPPVGMQRHGQPHVSSSTHPQNMDISLRGLLNNQAAQSPNAGHMGFNGPPSYPGGPQGGPSPAHQQMGGPQMRPHFMGGQQGFSQGGGGGPGGGPRDNNFMSSNAARFQSQYQRMASHAQQAAVAAMAGAGGGGGQIPSPGALQRPQMMQNPMQNSLGFHGSQAGFNTGPPQTSPQLGGGMHSLAKWHIPQSAQQSSMCSQQGPLLPFANGRQTSENFKISLKSPNTLKNSTPPSLGLGVPGGMPGLGNGSSINAQLNAAALGLGPSVSILSNVTSTNPKTPSPSTHENTKDFTEPIDKVRDDSINDLIATIAKLDSNGVQVLPEGRTKTTSPQVHSSTDLSNTQEVNNKNEQKDDPNEDWCAVCLDGGELMCCDKCPKVFHQNCHIPAISSLPDESESWQCLLCVNLKELTKNDGTGTTTDKTSHPGELSSLELRILQRICLELYCQYEQSLNFREPESPANTSYYEIVSSPMSLDVIRTRLDPSSPNHYKDIAGFVTDVRLIFSNTYLFYQDTKTYTNAKYLENFFEEQLAKWLPNFEGKVSGKGGSASSSPALLAAAGIAAGSPSPIENGRKSCGSASLGDNDGACLPAKRPRRTLHE